MAQDPLKTWETLFERTLVLIDSAIASGGTLPRWSFGGGTVLMRRHRHRLSKDIDIFVPDPQILPYLSPRLNETAESMSSDYDEQANFLKLQFAEGEIDFVASEWLTHDPVDRERLFGRAVEVEKSAEIVAKKVWHRGSQFKARDLFDLAMVAELEGSALRQIRPILEGQRAVLLKRIAEAQTVLREDFESLEVLDYKRGFDECVEIVKNALG